MAIRRVKPTYNLLMGGFKAKVGKKGPKDYALEEYGACSNIIRGELSAEFAGIFTEFTDPDYILQKRESNSELVGAEMSLLQVK